MLPDAPAAPLADPSRPGADALRRRVAELEALCRLAVETAASVDAEEIFAVVCARLPALLAADFAALSAPLVEGRLDWSADPARPAPDAAEVDDALGRARAARETVVAEGADASLVAVPVRARGGDGALLVGWRRAGAPGEEEVRLVEGLAEQAGAALSNAARYAEMEAAAERRERFFSAMSHDLRTPITAIVGYSELLQDGIVGELTERQQEMMDRICQVSSHLSVLVNDIMDLAKLDAGRMEFHLERAVLGELVEEAILAVEPQAVAKGLPIRLEVDEVRDRPLRLDAQRVRQILVNILANAVKFTERGEVTVAAGAEGGRPWIEVRDTGPGLPAGSEEAVFEEFLQVAAGTRGKREPGSGLGLAISRRLARAMGGDLAARSRSGGGAAFILLLPPQPDAP